MINGVAVSGVTLWRPGGLASSLRWGAFVFSHWENFWARGHRSTVILPVSAPAAGTPAWSVTMALMLLILSVASVRPALGRLRLSRPSQASNASATPSPQSTPAAVSDGISESPTHCPTRFVTAVVSDGRGGVWVSGEDFGIYHGVAVRHDAIGVKAAAKASRDAGKATPPRFRWQHFDVSNSPGLASNFITALCVDGQGRLWAGTNRHGLSVFNGKKWKHYNIVTGPLGSHVYALAYDAIASQVWIATENGISIYQCGQTAGMNPAARRRMVRGRKPLRMLRYAPHTWHYVSAMNGLPPNPDCIAFDSHGNAFVGTQCNGLAIGTPGMALPVGTLPGQPFAKRKLTWQWRVITGPQHISQLRTAYGYGLPGNLINCILVTANNHIYVGTDWGLAYSINDGQSFRYQRGRDYAAKIMGLWHPPRGYRPPTARFLSKLLPGDHITCLAQDADGNIWIGTWRNGYEVLNPQTGQEFKSEDSPALAKEDGYISQLCPVNESSKLKLMRSDLVVNDRRSGLKIPIQMNQTMLIGRYGFGVHAFGKVIRKAAAISRVAWRSLHHRPAIFKLPEKARPPTERQILSLKAKLALGTKQAGKIRYPFAAGLRDDWTTQGDWTARYGREYALLCTAHYDLDYHVIARNYGEEVHGMVGPHHRKFEAIREWEAWADTDDSRSLYIPQIGHRRQTNWDDHGETYPITFQGPDVWVRVHLNNPGLYRLSLYFFNKDGHSGADRQRDWRVEIFPLRSRFAPALKVPLLAARAMPQTRPALRWAAAAMRAAPLAQARAVDDWGPVYTRFVIAGPGQYMVRIVRGSSVNTEICGIFIDRAAAPRTPFDSKAMTGFGGVDYCPPPISTGPSGSSGSPVIPAIVSLWHVAKRSFGTSGVNIRQYARFMVYRYAVAHHAPSALLARWRWRLDIWTPADRLLFDKMMNKGFWAMLKGWKGLKEALEKNHDFQSNSGELGHG